MSTELISGRVNDVGIQESRIENVHSFQSFSPLPRLSIMSSLQSSDVNSDVQKNKGFINTIKQKIISLFKRIFSCCGNKNKRQLGPAPTTNSSGSTNVNPARTPEALDAVMQRELGQENIRDRLLAEVIIPYVDFLGDGRVGCQISQRYRPQQRQALAELLSQETQLRLRNELSSSDALNNLLDPSIDHLQGEVISAVWAAANDLSFACRPGSLIHDALEIAQHPSEEDLLAACPRELRDQFLALPNRLRIRIFEQQRQSLQAVNVGELVLALEGNVVRSCISDARRETPFPLPAEERESGYVPQHARAADAVLRRLPEPLSTRIRSLAFSEQLQLLRIASIREQLLGSIEGNIRNDQELQTHARNDLAGGGLQESTRLEIESYMTGEELDLFRYLQPSTRGRLLIAAARNAQEPV